MTILGVNKLQSYKYYPCNELLKIQFCIFLPPRLFIIACIAQKIDHLSLFMTLKHNDCVAAWNLIHGAV